MILGGDPWRNPWHNPWHKSWHKCLVVILGAILGTILGTILGNNPAWLEFWLVTRTHEWHAQYSAHELFTHRTLN